MSQKFKKLALFRQFFYIDRNLFFVIVIQTKNMHTTLKRIVCM